jgi:serine protease AprX
MSSSSVPPEKQPKVEAFDPLVLDRSVIAIPLLRQMQADFERIKFIEEKYPDALREFNAVIEYDWTYPGGEEAAVAEVDKMLKDAATQTLAASAQRLERARKEAGPAPEDGGRKLKLQEDSRAALKEAIDTQAMGPFQEEKRYRFAQLHAGVIRRLLAENERRAARDPPLPKPIFRITPRRFEIIIDLNLEHPEGKDAARQWVIRNIEEAKRLEGLRDAGQEVHWEKHQRDSQYVFARLEARAIRKLVELDMDAAKATVAEVAAKAAAAKAAEAAVEKTQATTEGSGIPSPIDASRYRAIFHIWPDFPISACINKSIATVKANAAQNAFSATGEGITWAVMDSGIQQDHRHFKIHANVDKDSPLHRDYTVDGTGPFNDQNGHGTHVAGIIAGEWRVAPGSPEDQPIAVSRYLKTGDVEYQAARLEGICGMAPRCKLVSLRVLDEDGKGTVSNLIAAINHVQEQNGYGRRLVIHGVNMSLGYNFEPEWFACGQSPLCVEVDRLVKSGVVVVVAAGNTGYGTLKSTIGATSAGMALTINDPGNADLAITVGSTHRDMPHVYGVSYFSSKGPTGDGRLKPDLVAPGEKIISCAAGNLKSEGAKGQECDYVETSGTSMAAPHVSGVIAAFLSVRGEFIGKAERVKEIFMSTATDLRRDRYFQGAGLVDLMRAIQSV